MVNSNKVAELKNDEKGLKKLKKIKDFYKSKGFKVRVMGRHSDRKRIEREHGVPRGSYTSFIPLMYAERLAVYVYGENLPIFRNRITNWREELKK